MHVANEMKAHVILACVEMELMYGS